MRRLHLPLFLLAAASAVVIKVAVTESQQLAETSIPAQVRYNLPPDMMILEPAEQITLRLRGKSNEIIQLTPFNVQVEVSLDQDELGEVRITGDRLVVRAPIDFEVISKTPNQLVLTVEEIERRTLSIAVRLSDEPAAGATHGTPVVRPDSARVEGPRSLVRDLAELTAPVSLAGHAIDFQEKVTLVPPDPLIKVIEPRQVEVFIPMFVPGSEISDPDATAADTETAEDGTGTTPGGGAS